MIKERADIAIFFPALALGLMSAFFNWNLGLLFLMGAQTAEPVIIGLAIFVGIPIASLALSAFVHFSLKRVWMGLLIMLPTTAFTVILVLSLFNQSVLFYLVGLLERVTQQ